MNKKITGLVVSSVSVLALFFVLIFQGSSSLSEGTLDKSNATETISVKKLLEAGEDRDISPTYVQPGIMVGGEHDGEKCMRFVTAVKGNYKTLTYHRTIDGGSEANFPVEVLYEGLKADNDDSIMYYNGSEAVADETFKGDYYWACYVVTFGDNSEYLSKEFSVSLTATYVEDGENKSVQTKNKVTSYIDIVEIPVKYPYELNLYDGDGTSWLQIELKWTEAEYKVSDKDQITLYVKTGNNTIPETYQVNSVIEATEKSIKISRSTESNDWLQDIYSTAYVTVINDAGARYDLTLEFNGVHVQENQIFPSRGFACEEVERIQHTLSFDLNYNGAASINSKVVYEGEKYGELPQPERTKYEFLGWYTAAEGGDEITESTIVSKEEDHTLYAHWTLVEAVLPPYEF